MKQSYSLDSIDIYRMQNYKKNSKKKKIPMTLLKILRINA